MGKLKPGSTLNFSDGELIMSSPNRLQTLVQSLIKVPQQILRYISWPAMRIFGPTDDEFPETGVQPFEGDIPDKETQHGHSW